MTKRPGKQWDQSLPSWVESESEKRRRAPAPRQAAPKPSPPKPARRLHVRIELVGFVEMVFEGDQARELRSLLTSGVQSEAILDHFDPWSSAAGLHQEIRVAEDPDKPGGVYYTWGISEGNPEVRGKVAHDLGVFKYSVESGSRPIGVQWRAVP